MLFSYIVYLICHNAGCFTLPSGVPTPLPPDIGLDKLAMLCRMSDDDLAKLKLPPTLLTAIRVWRSKVGPIGLNGPIHSGTSSLPFVTLSSQPTVEASTHHYSRVREVPTATVTGSGIGTWGARQQTFGAAMGNLAQGSGVQQGGMARKEPLDNTLLPSSGSCKFVFQLRNKLCYTVCVFPMNS